MQVKATREQKFEPVVLEITFTSEQEIQDFYSICNTTAIVKAARRVDFDSIRRVLRNNYYDASNEESYGKFYKQLKEYFTK